MRERYVFTGTLVCETGLHIGSGRGSESTDAAVMTDHDGMPLIPGSSLKGVMRSTIERIGQVLGHTGKFTSCLLFEDSDTVRCVTCNPALRNTYERMREDGATEERLVGFLLGDSAARRPASLCDTCRVFGSPYYASKVRVTDAPAISWQEGSLTDCVRDGVGIDRDTETARENIKFDFQVVPPKTRFRFEMIVEDPEGKDLGLICLALSEFQVGGIRLGGIKSRGLGKVQLKLDQNVTRVDFRDPTKLLGYLVNGQGEPKDTQGLIRQSVEELLG